MKGKGMHIFTSVGPGCTDGHRIVLAGEETAIPSIQMFRSTARSALNLRVALTSHVTYIV